MVEMHFKQPGFTYSACRTFVKSKETMQKELKKQEIQDTFIKTIQTKHAFNMIWIRKIFRGLPRRTTCDIVLRDKAFNVALNPKYDC